MRPSPGVIVIGILLLLGSLIILAVGGFVLALPFLPASASLPLPKATLIPVALLFYVLPAIVGICAALGLFRLRNWARITTIIFACILIATGVAGAGAMLVLPTPPPPAGAANPQFFLNLRLGIIAFFAALAAIGVWWLLFFNRAAVKRQFNGEAASLAPSARPLSITVIAWIFLITAFSLPVTLLLHPPAFLLGAVFLGKAAFSIFLCYIAIHLYIGIGLLRLRPFSRVLALAYFAFVILNSAATLLPGFSARFQQAMAAGERFNYASLDPHLLSMLSRFGFLFTVVLLGVEAYFLVTRRSAFHQPAALTPASS